MVQDPGLGERVTGGSSKPLVGDGIDACPACGLGGVMVVNSRPTKVGRRRRRLCPSCRHRWSTQEIPVDLAVNLAAARKSLARIMAAKRALGETVEAIDEALRLFEADEQ